MDPYCKVMVGGQIQQTKTHTNGGKNPRWEETLKFKLSSQKDEEIKIYVYDQENIKADDLIGETSYFLDDVKKRGKFTEQSKLAFNGKEAGILK